MASLQSAEHGFLSDLNFETCLGLGGFGIVFKAIDIAQSETAVKFLFPTPSDEKEILRETILARDFNHPNIVKILNVTRTQLNAVQIGSIFQNVPNDDDNFLLFQDTCIRKANRGHESICIQMELCGETLRQWLKVNSANSGTVRTTQVQICNDLVQGLKYLHDKKIIHRDLKPENIMFSANQFKLPVKIGDFGLCRILHSPESETNSLTSRAGTPDYMAPEVRTGESYSYQADLFSLGLVIWEVLQLIPLDRRSILFDHLVNDKEKHLVQQFEGMESTREVILNLTKRKITERIQSIADVAAMFVSSYPNRGGFATTSEELVECLKKVKPGGRIRLDEGLYEGLFVLEKDDVEIVGQGERTVLQGLRKTCLTVNGSGCTISGVKVIPVGKYLDIGIEVVGSRNVIHNVDASGSGTCFKVTGDENRFEQLDILNAFSGIQIRGSNNNVEKLKLEDIRNWGVYIWKESVQNVISNVTGSNVKRGILVEGSSNTLSNIHLTKESEKTGFQGVVLGFYGSSSRISNFTCTGYSRVDKDWGLKIGSSDSEVEDSQCGPIRVTVTGRNASLRNVNCGELIQVEVRATGVNLIDCQGAALHAPSHVTSANCNFLSSTTIVPNEDLTSESSDSSESSD